MSNLVPEEPITQELVLKAEDRLYVSLLSQGFSLVEAYTESYPENAALQRQLAIIAAADEYDGDDYSKMKLHETKRRNARQRIWLYAREKRRTRKITMAFDTLVTRMRDIASDGLDVWQDIMVNGRSEKVRGDLAVRAVEHQIGQPTIKQVSQSNNEITITVGEAPEDKRDAKEIAMNKARMEAGIDVEKHNRIKRREEPEEPLVIDVDQ